MAAENTSSDGIVLDSRLTVRVVKYYALIGAGLGLLGVILIGGLGGGGSGGAIVSGILSMIVFSFAVLCGPLIAAIISFETSNGGTDPRQHAVSSGIANGIGFVVLGFVVFVFLALGLTLFLSDGGASAGAGSGGTGGGDSGGAQTPLGFVTFIGLVAIMAIPNGLVGGGITYFLGTRDEQISH